MAFQISLFLRVCLLSLLLPSGFGQECDDSKCIDDAEGLFATHCCHKDKLSDEEMDATPTCSAGYKWKRDGFCKMHLIGDSV